jgi:hypothetical protein
VRSRVMQLMTMGAILLARLDLLSAGPILWVDDSAGRIGTVDVATGAATVVGNAGVVLTDIAFDPSGNLYGISFSSLYQINKNTGAATFIGNNGVTEMNALVFGANGTLYAASSSDTNLYTINLSTGAATALGNIGRASAGDLAFNGGNLYESDAADHLLRINLAIPSATDLGPIGFSSVYGLANGDNGVLYGVAGTQVFSVNTSTGQGTLVSNYGGTSSLGAAYGSAFFREASPRSVPEPGSLAICGISLGSFALIGLRRCKSVCGILLKEQN